MEPPDLLARVSGLEQEVSALKTFQKGSAEHTGLVARRKKWPRFLIENWVLLSFVGGLFVAGYVKFEFDIDPLEGYRSAATSRELSRFYQEMGDQMMGRIEWHAAELDYRAALQINPNNSEATFGIVKAQVLQPLPGEQWYVPEVVDVRLRKLSDRFPDDYQIDFLKALRYHDMGKDDDATVWLRRCIDKNPNFTGCYIQLAFIDMGQSKITEAEKNLEKATKLDQYFALPKGNLASIYLHLSKFSEAAKQLEDSYQISPHAVTAFTLGQAYWYLGRFGDALRIHQVAADQMDKTHDMQDRYTRGEWRSVYMPLHVGDLETIKVSVPVDTAEQKGALMHFELSMDHALLGQFVDADREFAFALKFQPPNSHLQLIQNRMQSVQNMVRIPDESRLWLVEHQRMLVYPRSGIKE